MFRSLLLTLTTLYHLKACYQENQQPPPGQLIDIGDCQLHLYGRGQRRPGQPIVVIEHSLGGIEGYFLVDAIATFAQVYSYDRAGYGWSHHSPNPRTSREIVQELDALLVAAALEPPYLLVGNSFGSYTVRLYADTFPEKVMGLVLTDGLHESGMLTLPWSLRALKAFFTSGFWMSTLGAGLGLVRLLKAVGLFGMMTPALKTLPADALRPVLRSFCRPKHWLTMSREIMNLHHSSHQLRATQPLGNLPIISIKAAHFFKPRGLSQLLPLRAADRLRDQMHQQLQALSSNATQVDATESSHFVWIDQPQLITQAVQQLLK